MSTKVTYLASRSLAVYETSLIERFAENHQRNLKIQAFRTAAICLGFGSLAALVMCVPIVVREAAAYLLY